MLDVGREVVCEPPPTKPSNFPEKLTSIPNVGADNDFKR